MTFNEIYHINYAWRTSTQLTIYTNTLEKMKASEVRIRYGDYTVDLIDVDRVWLSNPEEEQHDIQ